MKILQVHNSYVYAGGEDIVAKSEAQMLRSFGHQVIEFKKDNKDLSRLQGLAKLKFFLKDIFFSDEIYKEIKDIIRRERPDVAHMHNSFLKIGPAAYEACLDSGLPVVQTLHNYRFLCAAATFYRAGHPCEECLHAGSWKGVMHGCWHHSSMATLFLTRVIETYKKRKILKRIKKFITPSEFSRNKFIQGGFDPTRLVVKPNFLADDPGLALWKGEYILYVGALQEYKGISTLLKAWDSRQWPLKLKIAGAGALESTLIPKASPGIDFLGEKPQQEVFDLIKGALCVVVPSECYETFGRVVIEAFACGIPVIASRIGALPELVQDGVTGSLFEPNNVEDLVRAMVYLVDNPRKAQEMGNNGRRLFEERYQADSNYRQLIQIYNEALNS